MEKFKELSKITITNITKDCGVNRQTFYYHFKDVYDLLEWIYMNEVIQSMEGNDTYDTWQQGFLSIFEYVLNLMCKFKKLVFIYKIKYKC